MRGRKKRLLEKSTMSIVLDKHQVAYLKGAAKLKNISVSQYIREVLFPEPRVENGQSDQ
jgi:hypothetical protein